MTKIVVSRRITEAAIREARKQGVSEIRDTLIMGFSCMLSKDQAVISFFYRYRSKVERKRPIVKVGRWPGVSADAAREIVTGWLVDIAQGAEPHIERERRKQEALLQTKKAEAQLTLHEFSERYYRDQLLRNKTGGGDLERLNRDFGDWKDRPLCELAKTDLLAWQVACEKRGLSHASIQRSWNVMRALLNCAVELEVLERNPLQGARLRRKKAEEVASSSIASRRRVLEPREVDALFRGLQLYTEERKRQRRHSLSRSAKQYLPDLEPRKYVDHVVPFILCIYHGGFRPGDLLSLRWEHLDEDFTRLEKVLDKTAHHRQRHQNFPLSEPLTRVLKTWWEEQCCPSIGYVFSSPRFKRGERMLSRGAMRKPWLKVKKLARLPQSLDLYTLRHNFASQLVMAGVDLATVKALMGHSSIDTTVKHYSHLRQEHLQEALRALSGMAPDGEH
ncbi:integrase family protein [Halomonas sp. H10-9-1]|uniref:integrase family protein n=1 Tax=Halomonas sp. H10-9-1 TaxID=2950871 RepID=UPI0032DE4905